MQQPISEFFEGGQEFAPVFVAGSFSWGEPMLVLETGELGTAFDTAAAIDRVMYVPLKKGMTHAEMEAMGLTVEDDMKTFRSTTATESFFAAEEHGDELDFNWLETVQADQTPHDLLFAEM